MYARKILFAFVAGLALFSLFLALPAQVAKAASLNPNSFDEGTGLSFGSSHPLSDPTDLADYHWLAQSRIYEVDRFVGMDAPRSSMSGEKYAQFGLAGDYAIVDQVSDGGSMSSATTAPTIAAPSLITVVPHISRFYAEPHHIMSPSQLTAFSWQDVTSKYLTNFELAQWFALFK
jgi:hypothetical protein